MKSKSLEMTDYPEIAPAMRKLLRTEAYLRGLCMEFELDHLHRYWEYASALAALEEAGFPGPARVLDVGSGRGAYGPSLAYLGYRVDEIDPEPLGEYRKELRRFLPADKDWAFASIGLLDFKPSSPYPAVFSISVMEHIPEAEQTASWDALAALVAPGGLLLVTVDFQDETRQSAPAASVLTAFDAPRLRSIVAQLEGQGFSFDVDYTFHGAQVFDYTFFRLAGRKAQ